MARANKYFTHVQPYLEDISNWYGFLNERQIAEKLGISLSSFENYKSQYPEFKECLKKAKHDLVFDLKDSLRKKAKGFYYTETKKTLVKDMSGKQIGSIRIETTEKYAAPDTGAIHLLLKNLDEDWRNDDKATLDLKREKMEIDKQKAEDSW